MEDVKTIQRSCYNSCSRTDAIYNISIASDQSVSCGNCGPSVSVLS